MVEPMRNDARGVGRVHCDHENGDQREKRTKKNESLANIRI